METQFSVLLLLPFLLILLFLRLTKAKNNKAHQIQIPGPWKLPLLGNDQLVASTWLSLSPSHILGDLSLKYGPLMDLQMGELSTVVVSSPYMAKEIMKTHDLSFVHRSHEWPSAKILAYEATHIVFAPYGDY